LSPTAIAQLAIILAPMLKDLAIEGGKIIATYRDDVTQDAISRSLELARSAPWPELDFSADH
jgi:hypothetical protein